ncbi:MAG: hypothetical protein LAP21_04285 [Acidobacteriia bacterium]|nr:hypothetical protein [Terriglobia bacterium]
MKALQSKVAALSADSPEMKALRARSPKSPWRSTGLSRRWPLRNAETRRYWRNALPLPTTGAGFYRTPLPFWPVSTMISRYGKAVNA